MIVNARDSSGGSDIDFLVTFAPEARWSLFDLAGLQDELESLFGLRVDLPEKNTLRNPFRRREILRTHRVLWDVIRNDLPPLVAHLERLLPAVPED